ncbi:MAG: hypothetical protein ACT4PP_05035 [Sporichthyaceae bacterium]
MPQRFTRVQRGTAGIVLLGGAVCWAVLPMSSANAGASYEAVARASASELTIANPSLPTGLTIVGGGPSAQARQDGIGLRSASSQFPDAGDTVPTLPGIGAALFNVPVPAYPFIAATEAGSPPSRISYPGFTLYSESGDFMTLADGVVGDPGSLGARSTARIDEARSGDVTATASTSGSGFTLGSYGNVSDVRSVATVVADGNTGAISRATSTSIGRISVPGLNITLPEQSPDKIPVPVPIPGVPNPDPLAVPQLPVPAGGHTLRDPDIGIQNGFFTITQLEDGQSKTYLIPADAALKGIQQAGVTVTFQAPQETAGGLVSGTYRFSYTAPAPPENTYYNGPTDFTQSTGLVAASVDLTPSQDSAGVGELPLNGGTPAGALDPAAADLLPSTGGAVIPGSAVSGNDTVALSNGPGLIPTGGGDSLPGADHLYLVLVLVAGAGFLGTWAVSALGVRS